MKQSDLRQMLEAASRLVSLRDYPPPTIGALRRRAGNDAENLMTVLRSEGHYAADIRFVIDRSTRPLTVRFEIEPGPQYRLDAFRVGYTTDTAVDLPNRAADFDLMLGEAARAPMVVDTQNLVVQRLAYRGYPYAEVVDRNIVVDHETRTMDVRLDIDPGPRVRFGDTAFEGIETVGVRYLRRFVPWEPGAVYDQRLVDQLRRDLADTGLFASAQMQIPDAPPAAGDRVPVTAQLREAEHRTIGFGASFSTTEGPGARAFWEHRNFFGHGERFTASAEASFIRQELAAELLKPNFLRMDQDLNLSGSLRRQNTDAFNEVAVSAGASLSRTLGEDWSGSLGTSLELTAVEDAEGRRTFLLLGFPVGVRFDGTDSLLDPTEGARLRVRSTPYAVTINKTEVFVVNELMASTYWQVANSPRLVLAARSRLGSIAGSSRVNVPASKRFYAGGGGSIRGIDYQEAGPLDAEGDPLGGRSVVEVGFEARTRITETIGIVPFIEGGTVYSDVVPQFNDILWGAGLGFRYHTAVGPVRVDVAVPLNPEPAHGDFQFYISLGQAF